ncbi:hypothetical protein HDU79_007243 [Rhizoclosmatium sp. JEL0117]|nr:hypothetical protein HDU79_007243 [Rhizoclosmatium sp. JEL0117]
MKQNRRLAALLALMKSSGGGDSGRGGGGRGGMIGGDEDHDEGGKGGGGSGQERQARFDKSFVEIQKLLEYAKNLDEAIFDQDQDPFSLSSSTKKRSRPNTSPMHQKETINHYEVSSPATMPGILGDGRNRYGRKPIKMIEEDLKKRIELLKSNQGEWEAFQEKIMEYQKDNVVSNDIIKHNRDALAAFFPTLRLRKIESAHQDNEKHRELVLKKKKKMDKEKQKKKLAAVAKKEQQAEQSRHQNREENGKSQIMQKRWFLIISVAARIGYIARTVEENRSKNHKTVQTNHAARVIQRKWRVHNLRQQELRKQHALAKIAVVFHDYLIRRRIVAKYRAADTIRQFFKDVHDVSKLMKVVQKYRFSVVLAQRLSKSFLAIRHAQIEVLCKYWDKLEGTWWGQRKLHGGAGAGSRESLDGEKGGKSKSKKKGKKNKDENKDGDRGDRDKGPTMKVSFEIKLDVITEDLLIRKKQFRKLLAGYREQLAKYQLELKRAPVKKTLFSGIKQNAAASKAEDDKNAPKRPVFKLLPPVQDMYAVIEKGFLLQTQANIG